MTYDTRVTLLAVAAALPGAVLAVVIPLAGQYPQNYTWLLQIGAVVIAIGASGAIVYLLRERTVRPLQTISNLLAALREDDFSIRARDALPDDSLGHVMHEINTLAETLRSQRLGAQEATALLRAVMAEIEVAIFAFDGEQRLVLVNRAAELGLDEVLQGESGIQDLRFPGGAGRWEIRRTKFWQGGSPHEMLVMSDPSQPLREQEREAWKRLIRVIGHELNNSLAPIKSIAGSLGSILGRTSPPQDWREDMERGLAVIASRADALSRFTGAYARLARLPPPDRQRVDLEALMRRVVALESRLPVKIVDSPPVTITADPDQLEQLLINVQRNAVDAALETSGCVSVGWTTANHMLEVSVLDEGPGLQNTANLFVPFFTTKAGGSGIGLVLSRQIAEAHGGSLSLENRGDRRGTRATLRLPL